jgi:hypothetical protein
MKDIEIGIPCGPNSERYANFLIKSIEATVSNIKAVKIIIGINKGNIDKSVILESLSSDIVFVERLSDKSGSHGHGDCLNLILENMSDSAIGVFADVDSAFICKDWDSILSNHMTDNNISFVGSEYHKTDGKIVKLPNVITAMFRVNVLKNNKVNFIPSLARVEKDSMFLDTGCEAILRLKELEYTLDTLKIVSPRYEDTIDDCKFMKVGMRGEAYQFKGTPISTHIGRSLTRNFDTDGNVLVWKSRVIDWNGNLK